MQKKFYTEWAYILGLLLIAVATAFMATADFGVSMVVAPAYLLYLYLSQYLSFFTFGMAEYILQGFLLLVLIVFLRRFKLSYLFSFVTALLYGLFLDGAMFAISFIPAESFTVRISFYLIGLIFCALGVALIFHTYISPEVYELFVKELSRKYQIGIAKFKTFYDCTSCIVGIILSFVFFGWGQFYGVKLGTIICSLVNGWLIGRMSYLLEKHFSFCDALPLRKYF